jgi:DNA-binding transcriptional ArsR family regulator
MARLDTAAVAGLFAHRSRAAMIDVLLDGREHAVGSLARAAGVAASTAAGHVSRLEDGGIVVVRRDGRVRLVRLAGPTVAAAHEALSELSEEGEANGLRGWTHREQLRAARTCYDHLAGRLGVAIADAALAAGAVEPDFSLGPVARTWFGGLGVDLDALPRGSRPLVRVCTDWTERREHLAGALGAAVCSAALGAGWVVRQPSSRALRLTRHGEVQLGNLGIALTDACPVA